MDYKKMKKIFDKLAQESYEDFVKALIYFEKGIADEQQLKKLYEYYIENDEVGLLNEELG